jgi:integrase
MVIGKRQLGQDVLSVVDWPVSTLMPDERPQPKGRRLGLPLSGRRRDKALTRWSG